MYLVVLSDELNHAAVIRKINRVTDCENASLFEGCGEIGYSTCLLFANEENMAGLDVFEPLVTLHDERMGVRLLITNRFVEEWSEWILSENRNNQRRIRSCKR